MEQKPSSELNTCSDSHELPCLYATRRFITVTHKRLLTYSLTLWPSENIGVAYDASLLFCTYISTLSLLVINSLEFPSISLWAITNCYWTLSWARWIHSTSSNLISLFNITISYATSLPNNIYTLEIFNHWSPFSYVLHDHLYHPHWYDKHTNTWETYKLWHSSWIFSVLLILSLPSIFAERNLQSQDIPSWNRTISVRRTTLQLYP
jgi:hypothetical protein